MDEQIILTVPDWDKLKQVVAQAIKESNKSEVKRFMKSSETRKMLGGISAAKLQSLRVGGHIPAINADGLWLYDVEDIFKFIEDNKTNKTNE